MEICILNVGKVESEWLAKGISLFESRIEKYIRFSLITVPDIKNAKSLSKEAIKEEEGKGLLSHLSSSDFVVLMDEKGKEQTSREFSVWLQKQMNSGRKRVVLVVGGPYGFSKNLYTRADALLSLSKMTFTHEMAKLILTEQVYRAMTILRGEPYHHD